jgi:hypothetical protein
LLRRWESNPSNLHQENRTCFKFLCCGIHHFYQVREHPWLEKDAPEWLFEPLPVAVKIA